MRVRSNCLHARVLAAALLIGLPIAGCKKASSGAETPDTEPPAQDQSKETSGGGDLLSELDALERRMSALDLPVASSVPAAEAGEGVGRDGAPEPGGDAEALAEEQPDMPAPTEAAADRSPPSKREQAQRCADVCDLSQAICELEAHICSLSEGHGEDPTYANACRRAGDDCDTADAECERCAG